MSKRDIIIRLKRNRVAPSYEGDFKPLGVTPLEYVPPCHCPALVHPDHPAQRPHKTAQLPSFDWHWMRPTIAIQPFPGTVCSPPAKMVDLS